MAVAIDASSPAAVTGAALTATTASFTPVANSLIVAICSIGNSSGSGLVTGAVTDSLGSTWKLYRRINTTGSGSVEAWVMDAGSSPAARTVTLTGSGTTGKGTSLVVHCLTGARTATAQFAGYFSLAQSGTGANLTSKSLGVGSLMYYAVSYNPATVTWVARSDNTALVNYADATNGQARFISVMPNTGATVQGTSYTGGTTNTGLTSGGAVQFHFEVLASGTTLKNNILSLWDQSVDAAVTAFAGKLMGLTVAAAFNATGYTYANRNATNNPASPLLITDSKVAGTDGSPIYFYSEPIKAVTIAGQIVVTLYGRESATTANASLIFFLDRVAGDGTFISTIVKSGDAGTVQTELTTPVSGAAKVSTIVAASVPDTTFVDGDRVCLRLYFDNTATWGGTGTMVAGNTLQAVYNANYYGAAGSTQIQFTESIEQYLAVSGGPVALSGSSAGTATAGATVLNLARDLSGSAAGTATPTGTLVAAIRLAGSAGGTSTATGALRTATGLLGASGGTSTATGAMTVDRALSGTAAGTSTATGSFGAAPALAATAAGTSSAAGTLAVARAFSATSGGTSSAAGTLAVARALVGSSAGTSTATGVASGTGSMSGASAGSATATGALAVSHSLVGASSGVGTASGSFGGIVALSGAAAGSGGAVGALGTAVALAGTSSGTSTATGTATRAVGLMGTSSGAATATGNVRAARGLVGTSAGRGGCTGDPPTVVRPLTAASGGTSTATGTLAVARGAVPHFPLTETAAVALLRTTAGGAKTRDTKSTPTTRTTRPTP